MLHASKCRVVSNRPWLSAKSPRSQLDCHESLVRDLVFGAPAESRGAHETELRVVLRVAEHDDAGCPKAVAGVEARVHERRSDPLSLPFRRHGHWRQPHQCNLSVGRQFHGREHNVSDHSVIVDRHQRDERTSLLTQRVHEVRFESGLERAPKHCSDAGSVGRRFWPDVVDHWRSAIYIDTLVSVPDRRPSHGDQQKRHAAFGQGS